MLPLLIVLAFGEEIGWRGYAVHNLLERHGLLATALIVGVFWAAWHLPSFFVIENYKELGAAILPMFFLGIVAGSVFLAWLYRASGGSILICALWHGTYNLVSGTAAAHGMVAAVVSTGVMAWAGVIVVIELWRQRRSGSSRRAHSPS
jgi:membrane protease YdiL (CAAX protease family)